MKAVPAFLCLALLLAGCTGDPSEGVKKDGKLPDCPVPTAVAVPAGTLPSNNEHFATILVNVNTKDPVKTLEVTVPKNAKWEQKVIGTGNRTLLQFNVKAAVMFGPGREASDAEAQQRPPGPGFGDNRFGVNLTIDPDKARCTVKEKLSLNWNLLPGGGRAAAAGKGVHLRYAHFRLDGSLVETNLAPLNAMGEWPRDPAYKYTGPDHRQVYVYASAPADKPAYWTAPQGPTGRAWDYVTLGKTFNEAVKGHMAGLTKAFPVPAAEAPAAASGAETLGFLVIDEVVDYPCPPQATGKCQVPLS